jgi:hypothetical protein
MFTSSAVAQRNPKSLGPIVTLGDEREVNYEEDKTYDGSAISVDRHSDGATG